MKVCQFQKTPDEYNLLSDDEERETVDVCLDSVIGEQLDESPENTDDTRDDSTFSPTEATSSHLTGRVKGEDS